MTLVFRLSEFGRAFATRGRGAQVRQALLERASTQGESDALVDFSDVSHVSYSFADELLGKLEADGSLSVAATNMSENVGAVVRSAVTRRAGVLLER